MTAGRWARRVTAVLAGAAVCTACGLGGGGAGGGGNTYNGSSLPAVVSASLASPGQSASVSLRIGQVLQISATTAEEVSTSPPGVLRPAQYAPGVVQLAAQAAGQTTVSVTEAPACTPGPSCAQYRVVVGTLNVTVTG